MLLVKLPNVIMHLMKWFKLIKNILVVTGSRADYGLLKKLMMLIDADPEMKLQIIATGSHLSLKHGLTYKEIEEDGTLHQLQERFYSHIEHLGQISTNTFAKAVNKKLPPYEALIKKLPNNTK